MTCGDQFEVVVHRYDHDTSKTNNIAHEEKRKAMHKMMLENHEHVFDTSDDEIDNNGPKNQDDENDENDEGGIPAWNSMRRSMQANKATTNGQEISLPSSACDTAEDHDISSVRDDHIHQKEDTLTVVKIIECNSASSTEREEITPTESEFQRSSCEDNVAKAITIYSAPAKLCEISNTSRRGSDVYVEYYSEGCRVMQGGFKHIKVIPQPKGLSEPFRTYPPLSNSGYIFTSTAHDPKFEVREELAGPTFIARSCIEALKYSLLSSKPKLTLQQQPLLQSSPDKKRDSENHWLGSDDGVSICGSTSSFKQNYSPDSINMLCGKCGARHIPTGWICSLGERDSCGSYLPEWFPAEKCENPWRTYTDFFNDIHRLESLERGHTTQAPKWNKVFHREHPVWKTLGLERGGWWRCRSGPNAPRAEQECNDCHVTNPLGDLRYAHMRYPNYETMEIAMETLKELRKFVDGHMHRVGQKDKAIALDMIRETMIPKVSCTTQVNLHSVGIGRASTDKKLQENEEGEAPKSEERMTLETMWNHRGPMSTLKIPVRSAFSLDEFPDEDLNNNLGEHDGTGMMMISTLRQRPRPPPISVHRQTSSFGSNFFSALLTPKSPSINTPSTISPSMPLPPEIPEEDERALGTDKKIFLLRNCV